MHRPRRLALATAAACALAAALPAAAQDKPVELKFAHWLPANHPLARTGFLPWAKSVEQASGGSIKVAIFPAQQLGKAPDHYDMARDGIADMTWVNPGYQAGRFPIIAAGELPFLHGKPGPASQALDAWYRGYVGKEMNDVQFCFAHLHVGTLHSKTPITDPAQIKGMKIRPANGTVAQMISVLGGTNVQVSAPESRDALAKGVADAITFPWHSIITFGIDKVVDHHADMRLYATTFVWVMNKGFYGRLAPAQKKVIDDHCNNDWAKRVGTDWGDDEDTGRQKLIEKGGHTIVPMSKAQIDAWRAATAPVVDRWLESVKPTGVDGRKALDALKAQLQRTGGAY